MEIASRADVETLAREYLCWADRDGALTNEQIEEIASEAADRWWDQYGVGWYDREEISELYEMVDEELLELFPPLE